MTIGAQDVCREVISFLRLVLVTAGKVLRYMIRHTIFCRSSRIGGYTEQGENVHPPGLVM